MNGGDGRDTVLDEGGNGDEQFVVKPKDGNPSRVDASRINNPFTLDVDAEKLVVNGNGGNDSITGNPGVGGLIKTEMNGGDGNDALVGTDGDDSACRPAVRTRRAASASCARSSSSGRRRSRWAPARRPSRCS